MIELQPKWSQITRPDSICNNLLLSMPLPAEYCQEQQATTNYSHIDLTTILNLFHHIRESSPQ